MDELEDEAAAVNAELQSGDRVLVAVEAGAPLDVEADDHAVGAALVDLVGFGEPSVDHGRGLGDESMDIVRVERHIVEVVRVVGELVVENADCHDE